MFDDEMVCLGAGITNKNMELPVETTIENKKLRKDGSNQLLVNGEKTEIPVKEANVKELVEGKLGTFRRQSVCGNRILFP